MARTTFSGPVASQNGFLINPSATVTAGGAAMLLATTSSVGIYVGSGAPSVSAAKGSLYLRTDGTTTNNRAYINTDGATTWTNITTAA
jgi:hypothetical protein